MVSIKKVLLSMMLVGVMSACSEDPNTCHISKRSLDNKVLRVEGDCRGQSFDGVDLSDADVSGVTWGDNICPDGTNSQNNPDGTCLGHLSPQNNDDRDLGQDDSNADDFSSDADVPDMEGEDFFGVVTEVFSACVEEGDCDLPSQCSNGRCVPFGTVFVPSGSYIQGVGAVEGDIEREVTFTRSLLVQSTEVTQGQWMDLVGNNPSIWRECSLDCPVEGVSWFDVLALANRWSRRDGLSECYEPSARQGSSYNVEDALSQSSVIWRRGVVCKGWRLPTDAEWEYFARAGTTTGWSCGDVSCLGSVAHFAQNADEGPLEVGSLSPNSWGIFDVHGNVNEWCWDWYEDLQSQAVTDPIGPAQTNGNLRVLRGGAFSTDASELRVGFRNASDPSSRFDLFGVRLVRSIGPESLP